MSNNYPSLFEFDRVNGVLVDAKIREGRYLYRIADAGFADRLQILNGRGSARHTSAGGRYHFPGSPTSYCTDNVLVAISEVLYHDYREFLQRVYERRTRSIQSAYGRKRCLAILRVRTLENLAYVGSQELFDDRGIGGTLVVFPDPTYEPLQRLRLYLESEQHRTGVVFASARHSVGSCAALFGDRSSIVEEVEEIEIRLKLLEENYRRTKSAANFDGRKSIAHATRGYYEIPEADFRRLRKVHGLVPTGMRRSGVIDFVRQDYAEKYPEAATSAL